MIWRQLKQLLFCIALLAVAAGAVLLVRAQRTSDMQLLSVQSGSMAPAFYKGDLVSVRRVPTRELAVGDVVTYKNLRQPGQTISHRIIALPSAHTKYRFITQGDANATADAPVAPRAILGKVTHRLPYAGYAVDTARQPLGLLIFIYVPALAVIMDEFRRLMRYYRQRQLYRLVGVAAHTRQPSIGNGQARRHIVSAAGLAVCCLAITLAVVVPARAELTNQASLGGNSLTVSMPAPTAHIMIRQVVFECSLDNTAVVNKLPSILFYNPTSSDISTGGWYLQSSNGRIITFPAKTVFDARDDYDIEPDLQTGVNYAGDFLALFDNTGKLVDAISWGTDISYLHPALPGISDGSMFRRVGLVLDTDSTTDWAVSVTACSTY